MAKRYIPVRGKIPVIKDWVNSNFTLEYVKEHYNNCGIAWVLDKDDLIVDVDVKNNGVGLLSLKQLEIDLGIKLPTPTVITRSGGYHIYLIKDVNIDIKKNIKKYPDIDFLSYKSLCHIPEYNHGYQYYNEELRDTNIQVCPKELENILSLHNDNILIPVDDPFWSDEKLDKENIQSLLSNIQNTDVSYNYWFNVGCAIKYSFPDEVGFELFDNWSKSSPKYIAKTTINTWDNIKDIKQNGNNINSYWLVKQINDIKIDIIKDKIENSLDDISLDECINLIKVDVKDELLKSDLLKSWQKKYYDLTGIKKTLASLRIMVKEPKKKAKTFTSIPPPFDKLYIVKNLSKYCFIDNPMSYYDTKAFNCMFTKVASALNGSAVKAQDFIMKHGFVKEVEQCEYLPHIKQTIIEMNNKIIINTFDPTTIPIPAESISPEGQETLERLFKHIQIIFNSDENVDIFHNWIAHNVQNKGHKLLYCPLIQGIEGIGKSYFGLLLKLLLGDTNVGVVSPEQVSSNFNGWAKNKCVNVIEELYIGGAKMYDTVNALKSLITNNSIQINDKGVSQYEITNVTNYIAFTNFKQSLPLENINDRRWWVIFCGLKSLADIKTITGEDYRVWFHKLHSLTREYSSEILRYYLDYPITDKFKDTITAPLTSYKINMIDFHNDTIEGYTEFLDLIETNTRYYNVSYITSKIWIDLKQKYDIDLKNHWGKGRILKSLGYERLPFKIKIDPNEDWCRIWAKDSYENAEIFFEKNIIYLLDNKIELDNLPF